MQTIREKEIEVERLLLEKSELAIQLENCDLIISQKVNSLSNHQ